MSAPQRVIILAAGRGYHVDGANKLLIKHPRTGLTLLQHALNAFVGKQVTIVVGYQSIQIMQDYPHLDYILNEDWALTNNASSLGRALTDEPCYVVSGDMLFHQSLIADLDRGADDLVLVEPRESRTLTAIHCVVQNQLIVEAYQGPIRNAAHPEAIGIYKVSSQSLLQQWKRQSLRHSNLFAGQTLPCDLVPIQAHMLGDHEFTEINTPVDYSNLLIRTRGA